MELADACKGEILILMYLRLLNIDIKIEEGKVQADAQKMCKLNCVWFLNYTNRIINKGE